MIERLDSHDRHDFSTCHGYRPYEGKLSYPATVIKTADTVNTVLSEGLDVSWYYGREGVTNKEDTAYSGTIPGGLIKFYNARGTPQQIRDDRYSGGWSMLCTGYFYAEYDGQYEFYFGGDGHVTLSIDDNSGTQSYSGYMQLGATSHIGGVCTGDYAAGNWYPISLRYKWSGEIGNESGVCCLYRMTDDSTTMPHKLPISAGVTAPSDWSTVNATMPISLSTVDNIISVSLDVRTNGADVLKFTVPFISSASDYTWEGYYKQGENHYVNTEDTDVALKKFRMVTFSEGYYTTSDPKVAQTVQKFSGHIRDFKITYKENGDDQLEVICYSNAIFLMDTFNIDAPNVMDYIASDYMDEIPGHVNGLTKPAAYDGWELYKVFNNLIINSYIDPTLLYKKETRNDYNDQSTTGGWYNNLIGNTNELYLPNETLYGNPNALEGSIIDDEYNYQIDTGEYLYDAINNIIEPYGFLWGINRYGYPYISFIDVPNQIVHCTTYASDELQFDSRTGFTIETDFNCVKAHYMTTNDLQSVTKDDVKFARMDLIIRPNPRAGADESSLSAAIQISTPTGSLDTVYKSFYYNTAWSYYKGVDPETGSNPCQITVASNLPYSEYDFLVQVNGVAYNDLCIDSLFLYDHDISVPSFYFRTSDNLGPGHVIALNIEDTGKDLRNDCIVLGRRTGTKTGANASNERAVINPNNPTYTFRQSRSTDLNSIHSAEAINYVGRPLQTIIVDPSISSEDHADYVSYNFILNHRDASKEVEFETLGNPFIEPYDCISVDEEFKDGITSSKKLWVTEVKSRHSNGTYVTQFKATDLQPDPSYFVKTEPDLELFDNNPFQNIRIVNGGTVGFTTQYISTTDTTIYVDTSLANVPQKGYLVMGYSSGSAIELYGQLNITIQTETIRYSSVSSSGGTWYYDGCIRGSQRSDAKSWSTSSFVNGSYDPYTGDSMGIVPRITFDLVKSGYLQLQVFGVDDTLDGSRIKGTPIQLTTLTKRDGDDWPYNGYEYVQWGKDRYFTWNGNDDISSWNNFIDTYNKAYYSDLHTDEIWYANRRRRLNNANIISSASMNLNDNFGEIQGGIFTIENEKRGYVKFYPYFSLEIGDNQYSTPLFGTDSEADMPYGYLRRGIVSTVDFQIDYSSVYYSDFDQDYEDTYGLAESTVVSTIVDNSGATIKPFKITTDGKLYTPVYIRTDLSGKGNAVHYTFKDITSSSQSGLGDEEFANRYYAIKLDANIIRHNYAFGDDLWSTKQYFGGSQVDINSKTLVDDEEYFRLLYDIDKDIGIAGSFNPKKHLDTFAFINNELWNSDTYTDDGGCYWNVIYFSGYVRDKSGRICLQEDFVSTTYANSNNEDDPYSGIILSSSEFMTNDGLYENVDTQFLNLEGQFRGNFIGWVDLSLTRGYYPALTAEAVVGNQYPTNNDVWDGKYLIFYRKVAGISAPFFSSKHRVTMLYIPKV